MKEKKVWMVSTTRVKMIPSNFVVKDTLPVGIYNINLIPFEGWVLEPYAEKFEFGYKIYDLQEDFIQHVCKTYSKTTGNLGVLLNGLKGTGKTVTAKELANRLNLPVIIIKSFGDNNQSLIEYLSSINCDCIFFFDEFEKNFREGDSTILQIMDGVYNSKYRKVFLLTTNVLTVNDNLIGRPSRIRYVQTFGNLELKTVREYLMDTLDNQEYIEEVISYVDSLTISTIDILRTIVEEINCHGIEGFRKAKEFFNVSVNTYNYSVYISRTVIGKFERDQNSDGERRYTIENFVQMVEAKIRYEDTKFRTTNAEEEEQNLTTFKNFRKTSVFEVPDYRCVTFNTKFQSLRVGSEEGYWGTVVAIDHEKNVVVFLDDNLEDLFFVYIINPNASPSLYKSRNFSSSNPASLI